MHLPGYSTLRKFFRKLLSLWSVFITPMKLRALGLNIDNGVTFFGMPEVSLSQGSEIHIAESVVMCSVSSMTALGVSRPCVLRTLRSGARIKVGEGSGLSGATICAAISVEIGVDCLIGADVMIVDTDFHAISPLRRRHNNDSNDIGAQGVFIADNVFIGARAIILKGVKVGANSVIAAGSVVTRDIPSNTIAGGNPARIIRSV